MHFKLLTLFVLSATTLLAQDFKISGIGFAQNGNAITVAYKLVGAPGAEVPLYYGDTLVAFNGTSTRGMSGEEVETALYRVQDDSITLTIRNNGQQEDIKVGQATISDITRRRAAIIQNLVMQGQGLPLAIPTYTNWGFVFNYQGQKMYADNVEYLPGGLIRRTTKRNREAASGNNTYEQELDEILFPTLSKLANDYSFTRFRQIGYVVDGTYYYEGEKTSTRGSANVERFIFNNKAEYIFSYGGLRYGDVYNGSRPIDIVSGGQHVFGMQQHIKPFKWALFDKNQKQLTGFEYDAVAAWDGPGALVKKGKNWKIVVPDGAPVIGEGPWAFRDQDTRLLGYANRKGKVVEKPRFTAAWDFKEDMAVAREGERWGFINTNFEWVIAPQYNWIGGDFNGGYAPVQLSTGKWIYIDRTGKQVIPGEFLTAREFRHGGRYAYVLTKDSLAMVIDNIGNAVLVFTEPVKDLFVWDEMPGLFRVKARGILYYKDIYDVTYLKYDFKKGRLQNPDDIRIASERDAAKRQREQAWAQQKAEQERKWAANRTASANEVANEPTQKASPYKTCPDCSGSGYITVLPTSTYNGKKYYHSKVHYIDAYGIASRNYFTLNCSRCKGKGTVLK